MLKLAVLDIDGTLVDNKGNISRKNIDTIAKVRKNGGIVTLCTGRNINKTLPVIKKLGLDVPVVCIDGTLLFDASKNSIIKELDMEFKEVDTILSAVTESNALIEVSDGYKYYKYAKQKELLKYDIFNRHDFFGRLKSHLGGIRYTNNIDSLRNVGKYYQVVVAGEKEDTAHLYDVLKNKGMERIELRDYLWDNYLFINRKGIKKSMGVEMLCNHFNIGMDQVLAVGDENNDIDMIEAVGVGVAMENATEKVKAVADFITSSNKESGVAKALEEYFL